jgi:pyruvate dehydrogenase complex dehydrogenase (E1) component
MDQETFAQRNMEDVEIQEWLESLDSVLESSGPEVAREILERLRAHATVNGIDLPFTANTPYSLERAGDGGAREQGGAQHRRAHLDLCFRRDSL